MTSRPDAQVSSWWNELHIAAAVAEGLVVVAVCEGQLVGVGRGRSGANHVVWKLYVHPGHRGAGLGPRFLEATTRKLPGDVVRLCLEHFMANERAAAFYEREGFTGPGSSRARPLTATTGAPQVTARNADASQMRARLSGSAMTRPTRPYLGVVALALAATGLRTAGTDWHLVSGAAVVAVAALVLALGIERTRWQPSLLLLLPIAVDAVLGLLRQAQGGSTSGYQPLAILPVVWVGLILGRRAVAAICACTTLLFAVPILVVGSPLYPPAAWRSVVLWTIVSLLIGYGAHRVLAVQRRTARLARMHAAGLDRVIETQTAIGTAELSLDDVMTATVEGALNVTEADGACIELLDGEEVVCAAVAGTAVPFLGLRLPANTSITGECFRTRQVLICTDSEKDTRVAREACQLVGARSLIAIPLLHGGVAKGVLIVWSDEAHEFVAAEAQLLALLANTIGAALVRTELVGQLTVQAVTDELTGLASRRAWYQHLDLALARARRSGQPLSVLTLDLDRFKQINDTHGHAAGDRLLKTAASCWSAQLRSTDLLGRVGGDEFGIILENTDSVHSLEVMARLGQSFSAHRSASAGHAVWDGAEDLTALLGRADAEMYANKQARAAAGTGTLAG